MIKEIAYDSFGNTTRDTLPQFFFPLGFAGGLVDPHTGFIRFGFRDYDPATGRFTAKDPLGDTGGDHDLYDYCVDDPVSFVDPQGLAAQKWNEGNPSREDTENPAGLKVYRVLKKASAVMDTYDEEKELTHDIANAGARLAGFLADSFAKMFGYPHKTDVQEQLEQVLIGKDAFLRGDSPALKQIFDEATGKKKKGTIEDAFKK